MVVEESIHVIFNESNNSLQEKRDPKKEESPLALPPPQQVLGESIQDLPKNWKFVINHPQDQIIGPLQSNGLASSSDDLKADFPDSGCMSPRFGPLCRVLSLERSFRGCKHRDEVFYLEAFLVDSILMRRQMHMGYLMMHMISCYESTTRVLPYDRFLARVFKDVGVDLSIKIDFEGPITYNTYDEQSMGRMKFEKAPDEPELDIPSLQYEGVQFEATFLEPMMFELAYTTGPSSHPSFIEPHHTKTSPHHAPHTPDNALWMDLSAHISSLDTRMEELAVVSDTRFYSVEDRMDQYQTDFTSQFEYLQQRFEHMEDIMDQQQVVFKHLQ
ncbi:hypothetical protein AAG906_017461 [Vitis piasezkii]